MSLSGYEEQPSVQEEPEETVSEDSHATTHTTLETSESYETPNAQHVSTDSIQDIDLSNLTISPSHSTPRPPKQRQGRNRQDQSPYRSLRQDMNETTNVDLTYTSAADGPRTPQSKQTSILDDVAMTPEQSPEQHRDVSLSRLSTARKRTDPLLHTVLDRNYRVQATPLAGGRVRSRVARTPGTASRGRKIVADTTLDSSPLAPPELHAEVFDSPVQRDITARQQRVPGVSVLTPGRKRDAAPQRTPGIWDSDDDDDGIDEVTGMPYGASPPKTMQFHVPQSRLLKTPGKKSSKGKSTLTNKNQHEKHQNRLSIIFWHQLGSTGTRKVKSSQRISTLMLILRTTTWMRIVPVSYGKLLDLRMTRSELSGSLWPSRKVSRRWWW